MASADARDDHSRAATVGAGDHSRLLLIVFSTAAGVSANLSRFVPSVNVLYLVAGLLLGLIGTFLLVPRLRRWLATSVRPHLQEVIGHLIELGREPKRLAVIVLGCAATTLGNAFALWAAIEAFGGDTSFITVTVVTMMGGTLASAAQHRAASARSRPR